jgi:hypothetical protein
MRRAARTGVLAKRGGVITAVYKTLHAMDLPECAAFGTTPANHVCCPARLRRILAVGVSPLEPGCPT